MRDPSRIDYYCNELAAIWHKVPDWRFGQLIINLMIAYHNKHGHDAFYCEDEDFLAFLRDWMKELDL